MQKHLSEHPIWIIRLSTPSRNLPATQGEVPNPTARSSYYCVQYSKILASLLPLFDVDSPLYKLVTNLFNSQVVLNKQLSLSGWFVLR